MSDLTQDQRATLERAKLRHYNGIPVGKNADMRISFDMGLRDDALNLQDLAIAQARIIEEQARRIAELEATVQRKTASRKLWIATAKKLSLTPRPQNISDENHV